jgi:tRNA pseudouridine38-40 synthase
MQRFKCEIAYDGSQFSGYQVQPGKRTVQLEVERALAKIHKGNPVKIFASGRTDAGVHARGQVIHFDSPLAIPEDRWVTALNSLLPKDIAVGSTEKAAEGFHSRFDANGKEYRYFIYRGKIRSPFERHYAYHYPYHLDIGAMREAAEHLLGTHDFSSFCASKTDVEDKVREIRKVRVEEAGDMLELHFTGSGFLYNMVRILTGTLLEAGAGTREPGSIPEIISGRDRSLAGKTAPAEGLYLWKVFY